MPDNNGIVLSGLPGTRIRENGIFYKNSTFVKRIDFKSVASRRSDCFPYGPFGKKWLLESAPIYGQI